MCTTYDEFHANKSERLRSFEATVKNIFDKELQKFDNIFEKPTRPSKITHVQIFDCFGNYYFRVVHGKLINTLIWFDVQDKSGKRYILFRAGYLNPNELDPYNCSCCKYEIERDLNTLVNNEELKHYTLNTCLFRLDESLPF